MSNRTHDRLTRSLLLTTLSITSVISAHSASASNYIEEVVVTAQKREQNLQDVAITLSAFNGDQLTSMGVNGTQSLQTVTPGLVFSNTGAIAQPYLRGVGTRASVSGLESSIATYVDDRYISRASASMFDFADILRIEVLKGPQGTLYGRNATGGAIRIVTKPTTDELEGSIKLSAGNYNAQAVSGTVSGPLSDTINGRFTLLHKQRDGYADNLADNPVDELDDQDFTAYRANLAWHMSDRFTNTLTLNYWERDDTSGNDQIDISPPGLNVGIAVGGISGQDADEAATAISTRNDGREYSSQLRIDGTLDHVDVAAITTWSDLDQITTVDGDGTSSRIVDAYFDETEKAFSQEFQVLSTDNDKIEWLLGAYFYDSESVFDGRVDAGLANLLSQGLQEINTTAWAIFGQTTWHINDRWGITAGGRFSRETKDANVIASKAVPVTVVPVPFSASESWSEFTPKLSVEYHLDHGLAYATIARGFKSGGFNYPASGSPILDPEILDMLELGFKFDSEDQRIRLNTSIYYYDYSDLQVTRAAGSGATPKTENAADSSVFGFDADLTWIATDQLTLTMGLNILDTEYKNYSANAKQFNAVLTGNPTAPGMSDVAYDADGESLLRAPDWSAFISCQYEWRVGEANLPVTLTYAWKDNYNFDFIADSTSSGLEQKAYGLLNARIEYLPDSMPWTTAIWINNVTDETYFDDVVANVAGIRGSLAAPRTAGIDFSYQF